MTSAAKELDLGTMIRETGERTLSSPSAIFNLVRQRCDMRSTFPKGSMPYLNALKVPGVFAVDYKVPSDSDQKAWPRTPEISVWIEAI